MDNGLRDEVQNKVLNTTKNNIVLEVATGFGKSYMAIRKIAQLHTSTSKILIVVPRNVLIDNWKQEFIKWHYQPLLSLITFTTYVSLPKHAGKWDIICFDEAHHLSERCQEALEHFEVKHSLFLSATLKREHKEFIREWCKEDVEFINVSTKKAIDNNVLPDPKILLIPLELDNKKQECVWYPKKQWKKLPPSKVATFDYKDKWKAKKLKKTPYALKCTQRQYYNELSGLVDWYKRKNFNPVMKNLWLHTAGERLQIMAIWKLGTVLKLLKLTKECKSITFCANIADSLLLKIPCVNSKTGTSNLDRFNNDKINQIACVNMLDEGLNLKNCQVGIFNMLNSSSRLQCQKIGRILRHKKPIIIIPFFKDTRDEEIVNDIKEDYKDMIYILTNIEQIKDYL